MSLKKHHSTCSCTHCIYKNINDDKHGISDGSKIDNLYSQKYLPLREKKLLAKLIRARGVYDDIRERIISSNSVIPADESESESSKESEAILSIVGQVDRGEHPSLQPSVNLHGECCSCCECAAKLPKLSSLPKPRVNVQLPAIENVNEFLEERRIRRMEYTNYPDPEEIKRLEKNNFLKENRRLRRKQKALKREEFVLRRERESKRRNIEKQERFRQEQENLRRIEVNLRLDKNKKLQEREIEISETEDNLRVQEEEYSRRKRDNLRRRKPSKKSSIYHSSAVIINKMKKMHKKKRPIMKNAQNVIRDGIRSSIHSFQSAFNINKIKTDSIVYNKDQLKKREEWACDPDWCIPYECNPEECYEKILKRESRKTQIKSSKYKDQKVICKCKNSSIMTVKRQSKKNKDIQMKKPRQKNKITPVLSTDYPFTEGQIDHKKKHTKSTKIHKPNVVKSFPMVNKKQQLRPSPSISLDTVFIQGQADTLATTKANKKKKNVSKKNKNIHFEKSDTSSQAGKRRLNRCFCTLQLHKGKNKQKRPKSKMTITNNRREKAKNIYSDDNDKKSIELESPLTTVTSIYDLRSGSQKEPRNQMVRISSSFEFNIEFNKTPAQVDLENQVQENLEPPPNIQRPLQKVKKKKDLTEPVKRCLCAILFKKQLLKEKKNKKKSQTRKQHLSTVHTTPLDSSDGLLPYECEPGVCIPGKCDPSICFERIKSRNKNKENVSPTTKVSKGSRTPKVFCECPIESIISSSTSSQTMKLEKKTIHTSPNPVTVPIKRCFCTLMFKQPPAKENIKSTKQTHASVRKHDKNNTNDELRNIYSTHKLSQTKKRKEVVKKPKKVVKKIDNFEKEPNTNNELSTSSTSRSSQTKKTKEVIKHKQTANSNNGSLAIKPPQQPQQQVVRISSSFQFNIEFTKPNTPPKINKRTKSTQPKKLNSVKTQPMKRCFCTLKFKKKQENKQVNKHTNISGDYSTSLASSSIQTKDHSLHRATAPEVRKTVKTNTTKVMCECPAEGSIVSSSMVTQTRKQPKKSPAASSPLLPYECEPGFCTPGECDPNICIERIKMRDKPTLKPAKKINKMIVRCFCTKKFKSKKKHIKNIQCDCPDMGKSSHLTAPDESLTRQVSKISTKLQFQIGFTKRV